MRVLLSLFVGLFIAATSSSVAEATTAGRTPWGVTAVPRGGDSYASKLDSVKEKVVASTLPSIEELRTSIVNEATPVEDLGSKADTIVNRALEEFASSAPEGEGSEDLYETKLEQIETALDAPLQVLYLKQLALLREQAIQQYRSKSAASAGGTSEYEAMLQADAFFVREAEKSTRDEASSVDFAEGGWDFSSERVALQSVMNKMAESGQKAMEIRLKSAQQHQTAMQFLQQQQQMIQQLQMQLYGQQSPWNVGVAYRIPDTNFNLQGSYQGGKGSIQVSCVPDEYAPMLGPSGFTNGVGPGNLGLSLNLSV